MTTYRIESSAGVLMGIYEGKTPAEALAAMRRDANMSPEDRPFDGIVEEVEKAVSKFVDHLVAADASGCKQAGTEMDAEWPGEHTTALADFLGCTVAELDESDIDSARRLYETEARRLMSV